GDFPVNIALHPQGRYAAVLHCGYGVHEIIVVDVRTGKQVSQAAIDEAFYGIAFSSDGSRLFCSGGSFEVVHEFAFRDGFLSEHKALSSGDPKMKGIPAGLGINSAGTELYVAQLKGQTLTTLKLAEFGIVTNEVMLGTNSQFAPPPKTPAQEEASALTK